MDGYASDTDRPPVEPSDSDALRQALEEERQRNLRLLAEFDNFRRRTVRAQQPAGAAGRREAMLPLLDVLDALEHALAAGSVDANFYQGVAAIKRLFVNALRSAGAEPIPSLGEGFDPAVHDAVGTIASDTVPPGTVVREERTGWRLGPDLMRPAQVVVAAPNEAADPHQ
jgi:molecular chaperone GrpE